MHTVYHLQRPGESGCGLTEDEWYELAHEVPYLDTSVEANRNEMAGEVMAGAALLGYRPVAQVDTDNIEAAWSLTQNAFLSWSMGGSDIITLLADLPVVDGETYGLRSTDVGDLIMDGDGNFHLVTPVGFKPVPNPFTVAA